MTKRSQSTMHKKEDKIMSKALPLLAVIFLLGIWQAVCALKLVPAFMLPSPMKIAQALSNDAWLLMKHLQATLSEAAVGLMVGVWIGFIMAALMDRFYLLRKTVYPLLILTQTVPTVAIAPLLVLWFGYGMLPKIILIALVTFFPMAVGLLDGFQSVDKDLLKLMHSMGANDLQILIHVKIPQAFGEFFSGLKIAVAYAIVGAVIAEWLGGFLGLGVYMTRVRKAYAYDKMFAVIFLISAISLVLVWLVNILQKKCMPWAEK